MSYEEKIVQTKNPFEILENEQKNTKDILDFSVLDYKTLCFKIGENEVKTYSNKELDVFYEDEFFVKEYEELTQEYKIKIHLISKEKAFKIRLNASGDFVNLSATLLSDETLVFYEGIKNDIFELLFGQMVKENFLILRLNKNLEQDIENFVQNLKNGKLQRKFEFEVCKGVSSMQAQAQKLILHKNLATQQNKMGEFYDDLGYCNPAKKDELLFEFVKPKEAKAGRNLKGEYLAIQEQKTKNEKDSLKIKDASIYKKEFKDKIEYYAAFYGFFIYDSLEGYSISKTLKLESVGLKTTGSIKTDMNEDISIEISNPEDEIDDSVKGGIVSIQAPNVKIKGHIGATRINAINLNIDGGTHKKCELTADIAKIKLHRGFLQAKTAIIDKLENARVKAENVYVKNAISSEIEADYIVVENLLPNNKLYPKKALLIENSLKIGNLITVFPAFLLGENPEKIEFDHLKTLFLEVQTELNKLVKEMENSYKFLIKNQSNSIKLKRLESKNELSVIQKKILNVYEKVVQKYKYLVKKYKNIIKLYYQIYAKLEIFKKLCYEVEIYIKAKEIAGENTLIFDFGINEAPKTYTLSQKDSQKLFYLSQKTLSITFTENYGENNIENIRAIFKQE